jgi:hypothetical protein
MLRNRWWVGGVLLQLGNAMNPVAASCQSGASTRVHAYAQAVLAVTHVDPIPGGSAATQALVEQPVLMVHGGGWRDHLALEATIDLEGLTMPGGVLTPGAWGEGFNDRRHPHTYTHEVMASLQNLLGPPGHWLNGSVSVGKGFVPFGSDDPMSRPALSFPVNHHWSQILERAVGIAGVRAGPIIVEGALFNGDEPERPAQLPRISRWGDSRSVRVTVTPVAGLELEGSRAEVHSPENRPGAATDQEKWHASVRWEGPLEGGRLYGLAEWARNSEAAGFFVFHSLLAEGQWSRAQSRWYYRFERTERPEEERTTDPFRSLRPHLENSILGTTRWSIHTLGFGRVLGAPVSGLRIEPILEGSYGRVSDVGGGLFSAASFYGRPDLWAVKLAVRVATAMGHRMGRYGVGVIESRPSLSGMRMP